MKINKLLPIIMLSVSLMGCGNKEVEQPIIETTEEPVVQEEQEIEVEEEKDKESAFNDVLNTPKEEPVVEEKEEDNNTKYYEQLIIDKNEQDSKDKATQEENMKLANTLMGVCTDKLDNSTFIMEVVSKHTGVEGTSLEIVQKAKKEDYTITEEDLQLYTLGKFDGRNNLFVTTGYVDYLSDLDSYDNNFVVDGISVKSTSDWNDTVDAYLFEANIKDDLKAVFSQQMTKGVAARYWPKDIHACLVNFLQLNVTSIEEDNVDNVYVIKGTTKEKIKLIEKSGLFTIINREDWHVIEDKVKLASSKEGYFDLSNYDSENVEVTCYIDKDTEILKAITARYETEDELTEVTVEIKDVGTTNADIDPTNHENFLNEYIKNKPLHTDNMLINNNIIN